MQVLLPKSHPILSCADGIRQLCAPLNAAFHVTHFSFVRIYSDLSRMHIGTSPDWVKHFYQHAFRYHQEDGLTEGSHWGSSYTVLKALPDRACLQDAADHGIANGLLISRHTQQRTELSFFGFSSKYAHSSHVLMKMINHVDQLKAFVDDFEQRAASMISDADRNRILLPFLHVDRKPIRKLYEGDACSPSVYQRMDSSCQLTARESACCDLLLHGYSIQEIANRWCRSRRTVEKHLDNVRRKVGARHMNDLLRWLYERN